MLKYLRQPLNTVVAARDYNAALKKLLRTNKVEQRLDNNNPHIDHKTGRPRSFWPNGARAAVSFTYDDGRESQLDTAVKDLDLYNFKGTFFLTPNHFNVRERLNDWKKAHLSGHEIHNHTIGHSRNYDRPQDFVNEQIVPCEDWLDLEFKRPHMKAFAYPEGMPHLANGASYQNLIQTLFDTARIANGSISSASEAERSPHLISSKASTWGNQGPQESINFVNAATQIDRGWAVLCFHDIVEHDDTNDAETSRRTHREIMTYLANNRNDFWVAPYTQVFDYIHSRKMPHFF